MAKSFKNDFLKEQQLKDFIDDRIAIETIDRFSEDVLLNGRIDDANAEILLRQLKSEKNQNDGYAGLDATGNLIINTDKISEGLTNLYFTASRVLNAILTGIDINLVGIVSDTDSVIQGFGKFQKQISDLGQAIADLFNSKTTDDLSEGSTNLYFTDARARVAVVDDAISNGVVNKSPSQNAVYQAITAINGNISSMIGSLNDLATDVGNIFTAIGNIISVPALTNSNEFLNGANSFVEITIANIQNLQDELDTLSGNISSKEDGFTGGAVGEYFYQDKSWKHIVASEIVTSPSYRFVTDSEKLASIPMVTNLGNISGALNINVGFTDSYIATLTGNVTIAITNPQTDLQNGINLINRPIIIRFRQDAIGGRTVTLPLNFKIPSGETLDTTANKKSILTMYYDSVDNEWLCSMKSGW